MLEKLKNHPRTYAEIMHTINFLFLLLLVFMLPFKDNFLPLLLVLWIGTWVLEGNFKKRFSRPNHIPLLIGFLFYFLLILANAFRADDINRGLFYAQESLSLIFFPLIFLGTNGKIKGNAVLILKVFIIGSFVASVICLINAFAESLQVIDGKTVFEYRLYPSAPEGFWKNVQQRHNHFSYQSLSFMKHPSYFSMYLLFAGISVFWLLKNKKITHKASRCFFLFLPLFFSIMIYLLHSRAGLIAFTLVVPCIILVEIIKKNQKIIALILLLLLPLSGYFLLSDNISRHTIGRVKSFMNKEQREKSLQQGDRISLWYAGVSVLDENWVWGISPGNIHKEIIRKFNEYEVHNRKEFHFDNFHNQYLDAWTSLGIFGLIALLFIFSYMFFVAIKQHKYLLLFLLTIFSINLLFESMLNRIAGIIFFMLFTSFLLWGEESETKKNIAPSIEE